MVMLRVAKSSVQSLGLCTKIDVGGFQVWILWAGAPELVQITFGAHVLTFFWRFRYGYGCRFSSGGSVSWSDELGSFERTAFGISL